MIFHPYIIFKIISAPTTKTLEVIAYEIISEKKTLLKKRDNKRTAIKENSFYNIRLNVIFIYLSVIQHYLVMRYFIVIVMDGTRIISLVSR